jgi:hypothetical protein
VHHAPCFNTCARSIPFTVSVQVRHDDWWALASQYTDVAAAEIATSHDIAFLADKLWYAFVVFCFSLRNLHALILIVFLA